MTTEQRRNEVSCCVRFATLIVVTMKVTLFCNMTPFSLVTK
jgi:hypothetical protein